MKLYEVERNTWVTVDDHEDKPMLFHHIDGMYSYCTTPDGGVVYLSASAPVVVIDAPK